jgi:hypothetical protein
VHGQYTFCSKYSCVPGRGSLEAGSSSEEVEFSEEDEDDMLACYLKAANVDLPNRCENLGIQLHLNPKPTSTKSKTLKNANQIYVVLYSNLCHTSKNKTLIFI